MSLVIFSGTSIPNSVSIETAAILSMDEKAGQVSTPAPSPLKSRLY